jgi:hypothetical protein
MYLPPYLPDYNPIELAFSIVKSMGMGKPAGFARVKHWVRVWVAKFGPSPNPYPWAGSRVFSINIYHFVNNNGKILRKFTRIFPYVAVT